MTIGNAWLGSLVTQETTKSQAMATNSFTMTSPVLSIPSTIDWVTIRAADMTETVYVSMTPAVGTSYSTIVVQASSSGYSSFFWQPDRPLFLAAGDYVTVRVTNAGLSGTVYGAMLTLY